MFIKKGLRLSKGYGSTRLCSDSISGYRARNYKQKKTSSIVVVAEGDDAGGAFEIAEEVKKRFDKYPKDYLI